MKAGDTVLIQPDYRNKGETVEEYTVIEVLGKNRVHISPVVWTAGPIAPVEAVTRRMLVPVA